jgi:hypothetical protein
MEKNNAVILVGVLLVGIFLGYIFGNKSMSENHTAMDHGHEAMEDMMHNMTASLEGKSGDEFDKEFLKQMIVHHEGALEMASMVLSQSNNTQLKTFAQTIISVQSSEIAMMNNWLNVGISSANHSTPSVPTIPPVLPPDTGVTSPSNSGTGGGMVACTMEAKMCPDGKTYVGRQGPNCEFAKCPGQ